MPRDQRTLLNRLATTVAALSESAGFTIIPNWRLQQYPQATYLRRLLSLLEIDCVLDVGANLGQYHDFLRSEVRYEGTIVSFEPIPANVAALRQRARQDPRWVIEGCALGRTSGTAPFNVMANDEFSSFLTPDHTATDRFTRLNRVQHIVEVEVRTLHDVVPALERDLHASGLYLKLDTQGYDLEVVAGAGEAIARFRGVQTEASVTPIYEGAPDFHTTIHTLQSLGFDLSGIFPNNPHHFPSMVEFDCYMVARSRIGPGRGNLEHRTPQPRGVDSTHS